MNKGKMSSICARTPTRSLAACLLVSAAMFAVEVASAQAVQGQGRPAAPARAAAAAPAKSTPPKATPAPAAAVAPAATPAPVEAGPPASGPSAPERAGAREAMETLSKALPVCAGELTSPTTLAVVLGKSTLLKLPEPITLRTLGDQEIVQARLLGPQTLYLLGMDVGATNMILQGTSGRCTVVDVAVGMDSAALQATLAQLMPDEKRILVTAAADTIVLTGVVADAAAVDRAMSLANAYVRRSLDKQQRTAATAGQDASGRDLASTRQSVRVVNMLSVAAPQQVLLEVKIAEVAKTLVDKLGISLNLQRGTSGWFYGMLLNSGPGTGTLEGFKTATGEFISIDAQKRDGLIKILAEPNLMAISGQEGSFLAGGKIYIPVGQTNSSGMLTIILEEKEFGVGLKFTPTVLAGGRINLKVAPEVSELSREGIGITTVGVPGQSIIPLITTRRAATTVQLYDGQSFAIGGLIKNNVTSNVKALPILGEIPILGALFRSTDFQTDKTELLFVVTPRLVQPIQGDYRLPTDGYVEPTRQQLFLEGRMEGDPRPPAAPQATPPAAPQPGSGFQVK